MQQIKIYKLEYFKVLEWNKKLKKTILDLEEQLELSQQNRGNCL